MMANPKSSRYGHPFEDVMLHPDRLDQPLKWKEPRRIFVNSLSDLFHPAIPRQFLFEIYLRMVKAERHTFQVLTKRPERAKKMIPRAMNACAFYDCELLSDPPENVWLGTSISSMADAWRAEALRKTPAAVRFLSLEPLLGPIAPEVLRGVDWVIVGGESGPRWRPMDLEWARELRAYAGGGFGIPFFFKQIAAMRPTDDMIPDDLRIREYPEAGA
jgi:protein gp37